MEELLFYSYQQYIKANKKGLNNFKIKIPLLPISLLALSFVANGVSVYLAVFINSSLASLIVSFVAFVFLAIFNYSCECYLIEYSDKKLNDFKWYASKIYKWLNLNAISSLEEIQEIRNRLVLKINQAEENRLHKNERSDKWMQIFIIPVVLLILGNLVGSQSDAITILTKIFPTISIFAIIYTLIFILRNVGYWLDKFKLTQLKKFAYDLQCVLDTQFDGIEIKKYDMNR